MELVKRPISDETTGNPVDAPPVPVTDAPEAADGKEETALRSRIKAASLG